LNRDVRRVVAVLDVVHLSVSLWRPSLHQRRSRFKSGFFRYFL
jgi:hypothetical protein